MAPTPINEMTRIIDSVLSRGPVVVPVVAVEVVVVVVLVPDVGKVVVVVVVVEVVIVVVCSMTVTYTVSLADRPSQSVTRRVKLYVPIAIPSTSTISDEPFHEPDSHVMPLR